MIDVGVRTERRSSGPRVMIPMFVGIAGFLIWFLACITSSSDIHFFLRFFNVKG